MCRCTALLVALVGSVVTVVGGPVCADREETERRLRDAGVAEPLRLRLHASIERGADFLLKRQGADGSFDDRWKHGRRPASGDPIGTTLLCALALRHVGTPATESPVQRAITWALSQDPAKWGSVEGQVISAAVAVMLLRSVPGHETRALAAGRALASALDPETGYWGNDLPRAGVAPPFRNPAIYDSQFAALGLWAARTREFQPPLGVWKRHARALGKEQTETGSWRWHPGATLTGMGHPPDPSVDSGIPTGRFIGLANLLLARAAVQGDALETGRIDAAIDRARKRLSADVAEFLEDPAGVLTTGRFGGGREFKFRRPQGSLGTPGRGAYHTLFALAEACLFADVVEYTRRDPVSRKRVRSSWYRDGAEWLLRVQDASGGWSPTAGDPLTPPSEIDTAYALLFLLRSPSAFHPVAPREVDAGP